MADFLLEIGCEEIPARMIDARWLELRERLTTLLQRERLEPAGAISYLYTPRRLAVLASGIPASQPDITEQVTGRQRRLRTRMGSRRRPRTRLPRRLAWISRKLEKVTTPKGEYLAATVTRKGRTAAEILAEALPKEIAGIYWARTCTGASAEKVRAPGALAGGDAR